MDPADLIAWVEDRVWKLLESDGSPLFHDDPTPEQAVQRVIDHAKTLARWAYLAKCRAHWRREERAAEAAGELTRAQALAAVSQPAEFERRDSVESSLAALKAKLSPDLKRKLAASWPEPEDRRRVAVVLGATDAATDALIEQTTDGSMKENTVQQMRSRARKQLTEVLATMARASAVLGVVLALGFAARPAAAEQTGGRGGKGGMTAPSAEVLGSGVLAAEQSGGRKGPN